MDRLERLREYTDTELLEELNRRIAEYQGKVDRIRATMSPAPGKFFAKSQAKTEYWREWHEYKAAHPDATVEQWRRAQKSSERSSQKTSQKRSKR